MPASEGRLRTATWTLADQGIVSLGNFLLNIQLARNLAVAEYGVFALLLSGIFLFQLSLGLLLHPMSLRVASSGDEREAGLISITMALVGACSLAFAALVAAAAVLAGRPDLALAAAVWCLFWQLQDAFRRSLMAEFRHRSAIPGDAVAYLGQAAVVAVLAHRGQLSLASALLVIGGMSAAGALIQLWQLRLPWPEVGSLDRLTGSYWRASKWAFVSNLLLNLRVQIFPWVLGLVHGPAATAAFQAVMNIANLTNPILFGLCNTISQVAARASASGDRQTAWSEARFYILLGAPFILAYGIAVFLAPGFVLRLFYGGQSAYLEYSLPVRLIMMAVVLNYAVDTYCAFLNGVEGGRLAVIIGLVGLAVACAAAVMVVHWVVAGAAFALLIANLARVVASLRTLGWTRSRPPWPSGRSDAE